MFHEVFVERMGISEGALLNLKTEEGWGSNRTEKEFIGVVTHINWGELSLFCGAKDHCNTYDYRKNDYVQRLQVIVQIGDHTKSVSFGNFGISFILPNGDERNLVKYTGERYAWNDPQFVSVLSPSKTPLGAEWIEEGHAKAMEFLTKKRSQEKLDGEGVTDLIRLWQ
jgi:hypothetical protein